MQRRIVVNPLVIQAVIASMPRKPRPAVDPLPYVIGYSLALALIVGGMGALFALLGV